MKKLTKKQILECFEKYLVDEGIKKDEIFTDNVINFIQSSDNKLVFSYSLEGRMDTNGTDAWFQADVWCSTIKKTIILEYDVELGDEVEFDEAVDEMFDLNERAIQLLKTNKNLCSNTK